MSFGMLHHVPCSAAQDDVLAEAHRVLRPGASFFGTDSRDVEATRAFHATDDFLPMGDDAIAHRLERAGFVDIDVEIHDFEIRFGATKPQDPSP
jgi:predicted methyltransferase